jgi:hypothetical protein
MHCAGKPEEHIYETRQCPISGFQSTTYEEDPRDIDTAEQIRRLTTRVEFLESKVRILAHHISLPD